MLAVTLYRPGEDCRREHCGWFLCPMGMAAPMASLLPKMQVHEQMEALKVHGAGVDQTQHFLCLVLLLLRLSDLQAHQWVRAKICC